MILIYTPKYDKDFVERFSVLTQSWLKLPNCQGFSETDLSVDL